MAVIVIMIIFFMTQVLGEAQSKGGRKRERVRERAQHGSITSYLFISWPQVKRMLDAFCGKSDAEERKQHLHMFILTRPEETLDNKYYERRLHKFRDRARQNDQDYPGARPRRPPRPPTAMPEDRKVCLVVDESGMSGKGLDDFFSQVNCSIQLY